MNFRCLLSAVLLLSVSVSQAAEPIGPELRTNGFVLGTQSYTFNRFTFEEACAKTASAGLKTTELFPGQMISPSLPGQRVSHTVGSEGLGLIKEILKKHGLQAVAYGVTGIPREESKARVLFEFAKNLGVKVIVTESTDAMDTIEKMVKEFDIKVGFHNHPRRPDNENYKVWDPEYILEITKDRDARIGATGDMGHWTNSGLSAPDCIRILKGRMISCHFKDIAKGGSAVVRPGTGRARVEEALRALVEVGFDGPLSIEHEGNWANNVEDVASYVEFVKAFKP